MIVAWVEIAGASNGNNYTSDMLVALNAGGIHIQDNVSVDKSNAGILLSIGDDEDAFSSLKRLRSQTEADILVIKHPAPVRPDQAWGLMKAGASDVIAWQPLSLSGTAQQAIARLERWHLIRSLSKSVCVTSLIGRSNAWQRLIRQVIEAACFSTAPVLILGESGTGKELIARLLHDLSHYEGKRDFTILDCATIVPELSGSEFFGHERGAFTGAVSQREGAFALCNHGTLFLDEIGELPAALQAQLLRVIQEHTYKRVGGNTWYNTHFRLTCATNQNLEALVKKGRFRADLYYRIANIIIRVPPLREREQDILLLARQFIHDIDPKHSGDIDSAVNEYLMRRTYRGNVRDLKQVISRMMCRHIGHGPLTIGSIPPDEWPDAEPCSRDWCGNAFRTGIHRAIALGVGLREIGRAAEDIAVAVTIEEEHGNLQKAARRLGVTDRALQLRRAAGRCAQLLANDQSD